MKSVPFKRRYAAIVVCCVAAVGALLVWNHRMQWRTAQGSVWTTDYHITYECRSDLTDSIQAVLQRIDGSASVYNSNSVVSQLNSNATDTVDSTFVRLYRTAAQVNQLSGGAYDPTVLPLVNAWGFGYKHQQLPTREQIDSILQFVGMGRTALHGGLLTKQDRRVQFDFSSIAKGLACDEIGLLLQRHGARNYMVEIGGEVAVLGVNPEQRAWSISIDAPVADSTQAVHQSAMVINLQSGGVATSGNYRKFKDVDGHRFSHIIDPLTGMSEESNLLSATVVASDCATADAWATACMAMGTERSVELLESSGSLGVMLISVDDEGNLVVWGNKRFSQLVPEK